MKFGLGKYILSVGAMVALSVSSGWSQYFTLEKPKGDVRSQLPVDYAAFASDSSGMIHLELYYQIYNPVLEFEKVKGIFEADYEMTVRIWDQDDMQVAVVSHKKKAKVGSEIQTKSWANFRVRQMNFELPPGKYKIEFTLSDEDTEEILSREMKLKLKDFVDSRPTLSDIELVQATDKKRENTKSFAKGDFALVPSVTGDFGGDNNTPLIYYVEIYQGTSSTKSVRLETVLRKKKKGMVYRDTSTVFFSQPVVRQVRQITLTEFTPGDYELEVVLRGRRNKKLDSEKKRLFINWSTEALLKYDYETAVEQLSYIAPRSETQKLKGLVTYEERLQAFREFWQQRDPTPGTPQNELKTEFYRRVRIANQRFSAMLRDGWRTDRGRIYIQYGEPDRIDDYPVAANSWPYQEWHYYRYGRYLKFVFVDEFEDGDYRLRYPYDGLYRRP
jgi:GWxTD domain-containing protein